MFVDTLELYCSPFEADWVGTNASQSSWGWDDILFYDGLTHIGQEDWAASNGVNTGNVFWGMF